ncbi:wiskott-Aldrich syndrome protein family member 3 [Eurytemora carolleeae]|uniref:wiskott-Aldrich syndrome protein family member 3 n=1 Tax=Eurytemora carolleeae TaxID=1294199 RepID=UPI000C7720FD|nr:wiskott-Aldrich syndrome protein family member 3 [Eurytemora carolleeae]|eukprot:XP_023326235.1 wiskott-Aldrich syndrome protein family member 3-like [Eurytemora affinis]
MPFIIRSVGGGKIPLSDRKRLHDDIEKRPCSYCESMIQNCTLDEHIREEHGTPVEIKTHEDVQFMFTQSILNQLNLLNRKSFDILDGISEECRNICVRSKNLAGRVSHLLNSLEEGQSTGYSHQTEQLNKNRPEEMQFRKDNRPKALVEAYEKALPMLDIRGFRQFRSDDIDPATLVSDPDYFFNIWRDEYMKKLKKEKEEHQVRKKKRQEEKKTNPERRQVDLT